MYGGGGAGFTPAPNRVRLDNLGSLQGKVITSAYPGSIIVTGAWLLQRPPAPAADTAISHFPT